MAKKSSGPKPRKNAKRPPADTVQAESYTHPSATSLLRPDIGVQAPFEAGEQKQVAVKVMDEQGNELLVVKELP